LPDFGQFGQAETTPSQLLGVIHMTTRIGQSLVAAAAVLLLLAGCSTDSGNTSTLGGTGTGTSLSQPMPLGQSTPAPSTTREPPWVSGTGDRVFFAYDRSDLTPEGRRTIEAWAVWLRQNPGASLTIEGHCDERGTREYNLGLGERRADAARGFLVSLGVDARRVATVSYGKERPAIVGSAESAWSQNRRAVAVAN